MPLSLFSGMTAELYYDIIVRSDGESKGCDVKVSAEYPDGSARLVDARERRIPLIRDGALCAEEIKVLEPVEGEEWTFVFQVDAHAPNGGIFRAIPLLHASTFGYE
jgi:hypothetical protein